MTKREIDQLISKGTFPYNRNASSTLLETHISYVILKGDYAYKIKKPIKLSFLNFQSLSRRKKYCEEEVRLNKRLSGNLYKRVVPIGKENNHWVVNAAKPPVIEYAVEMKRMDPDTMMNKYIRKGLVTDTHIKDLAKQIASFHNTEPSLYRRYDPFFLSKEFADIRTVKASIKKGLGNEYYKRVEDSIRLSDVFIHRHQDFIKQRVKEGYMKDCHGDLHTRNIFIARKPLIFDCVEFRKEFREIDILNDIAFLCMDLDILKKKALSGLFLKTYIELTGFPFGVEEQRLFTYFKAYRACIRAKITAIELSQHPENKNAGTELKKYIIAMNAYLTKVHSKNNH